MEKKIASRFDESYINLQNTWRKNLLEDLMRVASIYKTHGENICLNIS
jgi:hypothetical protein